MNIHNASSWTAATKLRQGPFMYPWPELLQSCTRAGAPQDRRDGKWAQAPGRLWNQGYANIFPHCRNIRTLHARRPQNCNVIPKGLQASIPAAFCLAFNAERAKSAPTTWMLSGVTGSTWLLSCKQKFWTWSKCGRWSGFQCVCHAAAPCLALSSGKRGPSTCVAVGGSGGFCWTHFPSFATFSWMFLFPSSKASLRRLFGHLICKKQSGGSQTTIS